MVVFLKLEDDPEIIELLCDVIIRRKNFIKTDDLLTIAVNLSHTFNPSVENVLEAVNSEFVTRLDDNFDPTQAELFIMPEDLAKIINTLNDVYHMSPDLKELMLEYITYTNYGQLSYETHAELAVLYSTKCDETYRASYFRKVKDRFIKELKHLKGDTMYKIIWALMRADQLEINKDNFEWQEIKKIIIKRAKTLDTKLLTDIMVMATKEKAEGTFIAEDLKEDLFHQIEPTIIVKMN